MHPKLILASSSPFRKQLLLNAGLQFGACAAAVDERAIELPLVKKGCRPADIAIALAEAKALHVSATKPQTLVIGSDQILSMAGQIFHKCKTREEAKERLLSMRRQDHYLESAVVIARGKEILWRHVSRAIMTFRDFDEGFVDHYLAAVGDDVLSSVGAYQFEGPGIQLFDKIDGDYFAIIGLPLLPLLHALRQLGAIDA